MEVGTICVEPSTTQAAATIIANTAFLMPVLRIRTVQLRGTKCTRQPQFQDAR